MEAIIIKDRHEQEEARKEAEKEKWKKDTSKLDQHR